MANQIKKIVNPTHIYDDLTVDGSITLGDDLYLSNGNIFKVNGLSFDSGETITWNSQENTINIPTGYGSVIQAGQELQVKVFNNSGSDIFEGAAVYPIGSFNDYSTIELAKSDTHVTLDVDYGLATTFMPDGSYGFVSWWGKTRNIDTSGFNLGDPVYISPANAGEITNIKPSFPNYSMQIGIVDVVDPINGIIFVTGRNSLSDTFNNFWNGTFRESFDFLVDSTATTITGSLSPQGGHPDLTMTFSDGFSMLTTTPDATITLIPGTHGNPQTNFVYIPKTTKVLTVSTSDWPVATQYIKVAKVVVQDAPHVQLHGALSNHNYNDELASSTSEQGHLSHITERLRQAASSYHSGVDYSVNITPTAGIDDVHVSTTSGVIYELHRQNYPALDMATGTLAHIVNDFTDPYKDVSSLAQQTLDSLGNSLLNSSFSLVLWGVTNKAGENHPYFINVPSDSYGRLSPEDAVSDPNNYSVFDIPNMFQGNSFLIARMTFTVNTGGDWTLYDIEDLRGKIPNATAGSGGGGDSGITSFTGLNDTPTGYVNQGSKLVSVNNGATGLEFIDSSTLDFYNKSYIDTSLNAKTNGIRRNESNVNSDRLLLTVIPRGYALDYLNIQETNGSDVGVISIGLDPSPYSSELVNNYDVFSNHDDIVPLGKQYFSSYTDTSIYISSDNWGAGYMKLNFKLEQIIDID